MLSDLEIEIVDKFLIDGYKSTHPDFPCGICAGCSIALSEKCKDVDFIFLFWNLMIRKEGLHYRR